MNGWKQVIKKQATALEIYEKKLVDLGVVREEEIDSIHKKINSTLNQEFMASKDHVPNRRDWLLANWTGIKSPHQLSPIATTGYVILFFLPNYFPLCKFLKLHSPLLVF